MHIDESVNHFSSLPVEVVEYIFNFLDLKDLKECSLVNQNFGNVISGSHKLMNCFTLRIHGYNRCDSDLKEISEMGRRFQKIKFLDMVCSKMNIAVAGMEEIGRYATKVIIRYCNAPTITPILPCFPNVVKLELWSFSGSIETISPTLFPKLKHLKLHRSPNVSSI